MLTSVLAKRDGTSESINGILSPANRAAFCSEASRPPFFNPTEALPMNSTRLIAIVLIVAGGLSLAFGGFSYTRETTAVKLGPLELKVEDRQRVNVPLIASAAAIAIGVALLVVGRGR